MAWVRLWLDFWMSRENSRTSWSRKKRKRERLIWLVKRRIC
uniref:Uncharacterized protein n=1 Tax=Romanomermis culicivorax TaxID=13658 RepID=A0A915JBG7_ROMCU